MILSTSDYDLVETTNAFHQADAGNVKPLHEALCLQPINNQTAIDENIKNILSQRGHSAIQIDLKF